MYRKTLTASAIAVHWPLLVRNGVSFIFNDHFQSVRHRTDKMLKCWRWNWCPCFSETLLQRLQWLRLRIGISHGHRFHCQHFNILSVLCPPSPQSKLQVDRFGHSCTPHNRKSLHLQWALLPPKLPLPMGYLDPHQIRGSLGQPESSTQTVFRLVQPFLQDSLVSETDRQTDRPDYSVGNKCPHLHVPVVRAMQSNNTETITITYIQSRRHVFRQTWFFNPVARRHSWCQLGEWFNVTNSFHLTLSLWYQDPSLCMLGKTKLYSVEHTRLSCHIPQQLPDNAQNWTFRFPLAVKHRLLVHELRKEEVQILAVSLVTVLHSSAGRVHSSHHCRLLECSCHIQTEQHAPLDSERSHAQCKITRTVQDHTHSARSHAQCKITCTVQDHMHSARSHAQCKITRTVQDHTHSARSHAQCKITCTVQDHTHSARSHAQCKITRTVQDHMHSAHSPCCMHTLTHHSDICQTSCHAVCVLDTECSYTTSTDVNTSLSRANVGRHETLTGVFKVITFYTAYTHKDVLATASTRMLGRRPGHISVSCASSPQYHEWASCIHAAALLVPVQCMWKMPHFMTESPKPVLFRAEHIC